MNKVMIKWGRAAGVAALAALSAFAISACSADGGGEYGEAGSEEIGDVGLGINKKCSGPATVTTVKGGFATVYSNDVYGDCPGGKVVQIDDYSEQYAVGGYTELRWSAPKPSNADCTGSLIWAYLFEQRGNEWVFVKSKSVHGDLLTDQVDGDIVSPPSQPKPGASGGSVKPTPGDLGGPIKKPPTCRTPVVYFHTTEMAAGKSYRIAATARLPSGAYQQLSYKSVAGTCGQDVGDACCWAGEACSADLTCGSDDTCQECGASGQACCTSDTACDNRLSCQNDTCKSCGGSSQACCDTGDPCNTGLTCSGKTCVKPAQPKPDCGDAGEACCPKNTCNNKSLTCQNGKCKAPEQECGRLGTPCCGTTCKDTSLACVPSIVGNVCGDPSEACSVTGDLCCPGVGAGSFPYCDNRYYSRLQCVKGQCALP